MLDHKAAIAALLLTFPAMAADLSQWANLREPRPGDRIGVVQTDQKRLEGRFEGFTDSAIVVRADGSVETPRDRVVRVYRRPRTKRSLRAVIGGAIGAAAGGVLTGTAGERFRNEGQDVPAGAWIGGGVAVGAGIGAATGGGYRTIYQQSGRH